MRPAGDFWALRDVSFTLARGRMLGVVGHNGAGKSTLLRIIGGVVRPSQGTVQTDGRISSLSLGTGFHRDLTGRENIFVSGIIAGLARREVKEQYESIVAFSELQGFVDSPLRTYSSGMQMRLAFAVAVHVEPEILLIDEVLSVGDLSFQRKCIERITQFKARGCTMVVVAHEATTIRELCDEALWLRSGQLAAHGPVDVVLEQYVDEMKGEAKQPPPVAQSSSDR